jgi:hypothetical protein
LKNLHTPQKNFSSNFFLNFSQIYWFSIP